jgi:hypothetical protein
VFLLVLEYIYCGQVVLNEFIKITDLLHAAYKLKVKGLVKVCLDYFRQNLDADNALEVLDHISAYKIGLEYIIQQHPIEQRCLEFIFENPKDNSFLRIELDTFQKIVKHSSKF